MAKKVTVERGYLESLRFLTQPVDQGQIVVVSYAVDDQGVYCRTYDQSDRSTEYQFAPYSARATEDELRFEPQNHRLPRHNSWRDVVVA